jgi:predicted methyltransferase MtxX (methanogen marker protein 4)
MDLTHLIKRVRQDLPVGIGLAEGDWREADLLRRLDFCPVKVFRDPAGILAALEAGDVTAAVRGSLSSTGFLAELKARNPGLAPRRIALLALHDGRPFLLGPVGIDEGGTLPAMRALADDCREFSSLLGWEPRIAVLSAGRAEDAARSPAIARSIRRGERLAAWGGQDVRHYHIMIEEALGWANCVVAPDGVTGNLIYRTLVHLGGGSSFGALYFPLALRLGDTSRNGTLEEYAGAVALANIARGGVRS